MPRDFRRWLVGARGAATTEKLVVLLFAIVLVGGGMMIFGPVLAKKYSFVAEMIGGEPTATLADPTYEEEGTSAVWYVIFAFGATFFFLGFVFPMLFPRARQTRARVLDQLAERFPVLTPLVDPDARAEEGMHELRHLADEVNAMGQSKNPEALEIKPRDFGRMASPVDSTMDGGSVDLPPPPDDFGTGRLEATTDPRQPALDQDPDQTMNTDAVKAVNGPGDEIPFDAVSAEDKPQMRPDPRQRYSVGSRRQDRNRSDSRESTTVDMDTPGQPRVGGDRLVAEVLRQSGAFGTAAGDEDETVIRDSSAIPAVGGDEDETVIRDSSALGAVGDADPDAPTQLRDALSREEIRRNNPDATLPAEVRDADDPDATTQRYQSYNSNDS